MYVIPCYHSLADCMRGMEFDAWVGMLKHVFDLLLVYLSSVQVSQRSQLSSYSLFTTLYSANFLPPGLTQSNCQCV